MDEHGGHYAKGNSEITQTKTNTIQYHLYVESKKKILSHRNGGCQVLGVGEMERYRSKGTLNTYNFICRLFPNKAGKTIKAICKSSMLLLDHILTPAPKTQSLYFENCLRFLMARLSIVILI